jgi:hypothetical protein
MRRRTFCAARLEKFGHMSTEGLNSATIRTMMTIIVNVTTAPTESDGV